MTIAEQLRDAGWIPFDETEPWFLSGFPGEEPESGSVRTLVGKPYCQPTSGNWWWREGDVQPPEGTAVSVWRYIFQSGQWIQQNQPN